MYLLNFTSSTYVCLMITFVLQMDSRRVSFPAVATLVLVFVAVLSPVTARAQHNG